MGLLMSAKRRITPCIDPYLVLTITSSPSDITRQSSIVIKKYTMAMIFRNSIVVDLLVIFTGTRARYQAFPRLDYRLLNSIDGLKPQPINCKSFNHRRFRLKMNSSTDCFCLSPPSLDNLMGSSSLYKQPVNFVTSLGPLLSIKCF